ncbi:unnamed protein product [Dicrocoelium dendriticum]|nr:unnamed protein product [Dicrocoelium dendriticum]
MSHPGLKCICEICCCGRHKCPHRPKATAPWGPCVISEYASQYYPRCIPPNKAIIPSNSIAAAGDPISDKTTQRLDYVRHPQIQPYIHPPALYKPPEGKMEDTSVYMKEYTPKYCPQSKPVKIPEGRGCSAKFDGTPTYRVDYKPWQVRPATPRKPEQRRAELPKFDAQATYRTEYGPKCMQKPITYKPPETRQIYEPFKGDTIYRTEYITHEIEPPAPVKPKTYAKAKAPLDALTTNRKDYTPKEYCPSQPVIPASSSIRNTGPMSKVTTNRTDYKDWGPYYPERAPTKEYKPPEGERHLASTYRCEFVRKNPCPAIPVKICDTRKCDAKFDGTTNYRHDYKPWDVVPKSPQKPAEWSPSDVPFDGTTTNRANYVAHPCITIPEKAMPKETRLDSGPFDDRTNYRLDYVPKEVCPCCPAGFLSKEQISPDGYMFQHIDERGHERYKNVSFAEPVNTGIEVR